MNYKEALDAAHSGKVVRITRSPITFSMRYRTGGYEWDWGDPKSNKWSTVGPYTWGSDLLDSNNWEVVRTPINAQEALQAILDGKKIRRVTGNGPFWDTITVDHHDKDTKWEVQ